MVKNKAIKFLQDNLVGAVIGGLIFFLVPVLFVVQVTFIGLSPEISKIIGDAISVTMGVFVGAFIQSKLK